MKNILIYSIPFGFGPTGKAIAIANELSVSHNVTLTSFKHSLQIIGKNDRIKIIDCKTRNFSEWNSKIFQKTDLIISIMDLRLINFISENFPHIKTVFVDSLFWWRKSLSDIPFQNCNLFLLQTFPGVGEKIEEVPKEYRNKFFEVSPILSENKVVMDESEETDSILLHFGGVNSLIAQWEMYKQYFEFITSIVINYAKVYKSILTVTGNSDLMKHLKKYFRSEENILFQCLDNSVFHQKLSKTKLFISTCGIEATYEAFAYQIPTIFLPPVNSTQLYQLMSLISLQLPVVISENLIDNFQNVILAKFDYHTETTEIANALEYTINTKSERVELETCLISFIEYIKLSNENKMELIYKQNIFSNKTSNKWTDILAQTNILG